MGEEENSLSLFFLLELLACSRTLASLANVFEKNEKKNKTTSVYRLTRRGSVTEDAIISSLFLSRN